MPELTNQPLPSGPHTLCFNKEDFTKVLRVGQWSSDRTKTC